MSQVTTQVFDEPRFSHKCVVDGDDHFPRENRNISRMIMDDSPVMHYLNLVKIKLRWPNHPNGWKPRWLSEVSPFPS